MTDAADPKLVALAMAELVAEAAALAAAVDVDLAATIERIGAQPLSEEEARPLFTEIIERIRSSNPRYSGADGRERMQLEVRKLVDELLESPRDASPAKQSENGAWHHLQMFEHSGLKIRPVHPTPVFNGIAIPMSEGYVNTVDLEPWPENSRLHLDIETFRKRNQRRPNSAEILQLLALDDSQEMRTVKKEERDRFDGLVRSIATKGVQTPPVIDWWGVPRDGNRRLAACRKILASEDYSSEEKERASRIRVWQTDETATDEQIHAIVVSLNFEDDFKSPWPEYIKATQVARHFDDLRNLEGAKLTEGRDLELRRLTAKRFAIKTTDVTRFLKMVRRADDFREFHLESGERAHDAIDHRSNELFQYFYELDAGRGDQKLSTRLDNDPAFKAIVYDLMYDSKFRNWVQVRDLKNIADSPAAVELLSKAHVEPDRAIARELVGEALLVGKKDSITMKRIGLGEWVKQTVKRLDDAQPVLWRELDAELLIEFRRALVATEAVVRSDLEARGYGGPATPENTENSTA